MPWDQRWLPFLPLCPGTALLCLVGNLNLTTSSPTDPEMNCLTLSLTKMHKSKQASPLHLCLFFRLLMLEQTRIPFSVSKILFAQLSMFCFFLNHQIIAFPSSVLWVHFLFTLPHSKTVVPAMKVCLCLPFLFPELLVITRVLLKPHPVDCDGVFPFLTSPSLQKAVEARGTCPFSFSWAIASESFHLSKKMWRFDWPFPTLPWANYSRLTVLSISFC